MPAPAPGPSNLAGIALDSDEFWRENPGGGWAVATVLLLVLGWQLLRLLSRRRAAAAGSGDTRRTPPASSDGRSNRLSKIVSDADLRELIDELEGKNRDSWADVIDKKNEDISYSAKCCKTKDGPPKYLSITIFEKCSTELLRDFYMDNEYRKEWDKTLVEHGQLQVDETSGIEIGRMVKKFPLLTPREYILAWRVWEGKDKSFYCFIKDCEHSLAPLQKKYVRVSSFRSGWRIRKVPGRDACEITMVHHEDAGLNVEMAKLAFAKGIWSYVCKMNNALRRYTARNRNWSTSVATMLRLIQKIPPELEATAGASSQGHSEISGSSAIGRQALASSLERRLMKKPSKKWIANGLLLLGGVVCLSRGRSTLGAQLAMACILKKLMKHGQASGQAAEPSRVSHTRRERRHAV